MKNYSVKFVNNYLNMKLKNEGFLLLIFLLAIGSVTISFVIINTLSEIESSRILAEESSFVQSYYNAISCAEEALNKSLRQKTYLGNETINFGQNSNCQILPIETTPQGKLLKIISDHKNIIRKLKIDFNKTDRIKIISWKEVDEF